MRKATADVLKWVVCFGILLLLFVLQTTVTFWAVFDVRPVLIVPFVVALSMQEREIFGLVFGLAAGFLWDYSSGKIPGFNAAVLLFCCVGVALLAAYLLGNNVFHAVWMTAAVMLLQGLLDYLFYYLIWGIPGSHLILIRHILPTALYSTLLSPAFFYLTRWLHRKLEGSAAR